MPCLGGGSILRMAFTNISYPVEFPQILESSHNFSASSFWSLSLICCSELSNQPSGLIILYRGTYFSVFVGRGEFRVLPLPSLTSWILNLFRLVLWLNIWCILKNVSSVLEKNETLMLLDEISAYFCIWLLVYAIQIHFFLYWFSIWIIYPLFWVKYHSPQLLIYYHLFLLLNLLQLALYT